MRPREVRILDDAAAVARATAEAFVESADQALRARGRFGVALAGGSSPKAAFARLAEPPLLERVDWSRVHVFFGDERCVPPDHPDSNFRMAEEALLRKVSIPHGQIDRMAGERPPVEAAESYEAELDAWGAPLDLALLGMGPDGHTASLFPGTRAVDEETRRVVAVYVPTLDAWRVTLTAPALSAARRVVVSTAGPEKANALALALEGPPGSVPIQRVQAAEMRWLVDRAAASALAL